MGYLQPAEAARLERRKEDGGHEEKTVWFSSFTHQIILARVFAYPSLFSEKITN